MSTATEVRTRERISEEMDAVNLAQHLVGKRVGGIERMLRHGPASAAAAWDVLNDLWGELYDERERTPE